MQKVTMSVGCGACRDAGLDVRPRGLRVIRLHDARHVTATLLTAAGVASRVVMEILGHSRIGITMDVYTHDMQDTQREAMSHMDRLLRKRRPGRQ
jgi:integrase